MALRIIPHELTREQFHFCQKRRHGQHRSPWPGILRRNSKHQPLTVTGYVAITISGLAQTSFNRNTKKVCCKVDGM